MLSLKRLRRNEAAAYVQETHGIPCAPKTLAKYAVIGGGPIFRNPESSHFTNRPISMNGLRANSANQFGRPLNCGRLLDTCSFPNAKGRPDAITSQTASTRCLA